MVAVHGQDAAVAQLDQVGRVTPHRSHLRLRPAIAAVVRSHLPQVVGLLAVAHMAEKPSERSRIIVGSLKAYFG